MIKTYSNLISPEDITSLLNYHNIVDDRTDSRPDVISKHPRWGIDPWPEHIVANLLDKILDYEYEIDEVIFNQSRISFRLHADSGRDKNDRDGHGILIPLSCKGICTTIFFNNFWNGTSTKFSKIEIHPFEYTLLNKHGNWQNISDLRQLLHLSLTDPDLITDFIIDEGFIKTLEYLIEARNNKKISKIDGRCYDYTEVVNYDPDLKFDTKFHNDYLSHIPIQTLHGLTVDSLIFWNIGNCIVFDRNQLHCAGSGHSEKIGLTVFTRRYQ
jgi:hypothetical protein